MEDYMKEILELERRERPAQVSVLDQALSPADWAVIAEMLRASQEMHQQWQLIQELAKYYSAVTGVLAARDWRLKLIALAFDVARETVTERDTEDFLARQGAVPVLNQSEFMCNSSLHNRSSQPLNHKPRSSSVKGQQEMFPDERRA